MSAGTDVGRRSRHRRGCLAAAAVCCLLTSCVNGAALPEPLTAEERTIGYVVNGPLVTKPPSDGAGGGHGAGVVGQVAEADGCLTLGGEVVLWPYRTSWSEDPAGVVLPEGDPVPVGWFVEGAGAHLSADVWDLPQPVRDHIVACGGSLDEVAAFNDGADAAFDYAEDADALDRITGIDR